MQAKLGASTNAVRRQANVLPANAPVPMAKVDMTAGLATAKGSLAKPRTHRRLPSELPRMAARRGTNTRAVRSAVNRAITVSQTIHNV